MVFVLTFLCICVTDFDNQTTILTGLKEFCEYKISVVAYVFNGTDQVLDTQDENNGETSDKTLEARKNLLHQYVFCCILFQIVFISHWHYDILSLAISCRF